MTKVRLISKTVGYTDTEYKDKSIDEIIVGEARISSNRETNELFNDAAKLLRHCLLNGHFSIFEMANLVFEINTSRAIGRELLRHCKLVGVQERSQRYTSITGYEDIELRKQSKNNRQSSEELFNPEIKITDQISTDANTLVLKTLDNIDNTYNQLLNKGCSRETSRMILPECATTVLIMNFRIRELITFLNVRLHKTAQKEIRTVAEYLRDYFIIECPIISECLYNFEYAYDIHILDRLVLEKFNTFSLIKSNDFRKLK